MSNYKVVYLSTIFIFGWLFSNGQNNNTGSPYSRFGIGDLQPNVFAINRGMAGIAIGMQSTMNANPVNPAGMALLGRTAIEAGLSGTFHNLRTTDASNNRSNANLANFSISFPVLRNRWGSSLLLMPYSTLGYEIQNQVNEPFSSYTEGYRGQGGLNEFAWANGFRVTKKMFVGAKLNYLFGSINQERIFRFPDSLLAYHVRIADELRISDFGLNLGVQRRDTLKLDSTTMAYKILVTGLTFSLPNNLNAQRDYSVTRYTQFEGGAPRIRDTVSSNSNNNGSVTLPYTLGAGFSVMTNKWTIGLEGSYQNWQNFRSFDEVDNLRNSYTMAIGVQYLPNDEVVFNKRNYWKKVRYRAGIRYQDALLEINEQKINTIGMTFGVSLPKSVDRSSFGSYDFAFEFGTRGTTRSDLIQDNFFRVTFGITLNDLWFRRYKYD